MQALLWQIRSRWMIAFDHPVAWLGLSAGALVLITVAAIASGAVELSVGELFSSLTSTQHEAHSVLWNVRLPRIVGAALVGTNLATAGALLQTSVRNPLADPGILGVSAAAGVGALCVILFFPGHSQWTPWAAFLGGLLSVAILLALAWTRSGATGTLRIVLSGVALQSILFALIALLTFLFADRAPSFAAFIVGSLNGLSWNDVLILLPPTIVGLALALWAIRILNLLLLDDGAASGLGVNVQPARFGVACVAALLTAAAVSVSGLIGFVGLVVPNAVRIVVGPDHRGLLPLVAVSGAALVVAADTLARTVVAPIELPVGALLSLIGGPYFLYLLTRKIA